MRIGHQSKWIMLALAALFVAMIGSGVQVWGNPTVELKLPANVYRPNQFGVWSQAADTVSEGINYSNVRFNITVSGPDSFGTYDRVDVFTITEATPWEGVTSAEAGAAVTGTFVNDGDNFVGYWGPSGGFPMTDEYSPAESTFTVEMNNTGTAPLGQYTVTIDLVNVITDIVLATDQRTFDLSNDTLHVGLEEYEYQFNTIQGAIDAAAAGDTINVAAGTYNGASEGRDTGAQGLINVKTGVTIAASDGVRPVIDGSDTDGVFKIHPSALNPGDTVIIEGFNITGDASTGIAMTMQGCFDTTPAKVIIRDNWFHGMIGGIDFWGAVSFLPSGWTSGVINTEITGNKFYDMLAAGGYQGVGVLIESPLDWATCGNDYAVKIENNEFSSLPSDGDNYGTGIGILDMNGTTIDANVLISGNTFNSDVPVGIAFQNADLATTKVVSNNFDAGILAVNVASVVDNAPLDAEDNWWGTASGPTHDGNTYNVATQGPAVSDNVDYVPWLDASGGTSFAPVEADSSYSSIQAALDAASDGTVVTCAAGTFTEDIVLDVPNVELSGAGATTVIQGVQQTAATQWPLADANIDVLGAGCVLHDFTARNPVWVNGNYSSGMIIGAQNVEVHHVTFDGPTSDDLDDISQTFQNWNGMDISGLNLHDCIFTTSGAQTLGYEAIYINPGGAGQVTITDNNLGGNLFRGITTQRENVQITGNTVVTTANPDNAWAGINVQAKNVTVTGNQVYGTSGFEVGIDLGSSTYLPTLENIVVNNNTIGPGNNTGIRVRGELVGTGVDAQNNNIAGNVNWGIDASAITGLNVDATECWWGDVNGPSGQGTGDGDAVSVNVEFVPWLDAAGGNPVARPQVTGLDVVQSLNQADWYDTGGDWTNDFWMTLDPDQDYHYLDVRDLVTNEPLKNDYHEFFLDTSSVPANFYTYWQGRGVSEGCTGQWEPTMWNIINGTAPMFYLRTGTGEPMLVDGLQKQLGQDDTFLRVNGDYPAGTYTFEGTVTNVPGVSSEPIQVVMTFYEAPALTYIGFPIDGGDPDVVVGGDFGEFQVQATNPAAAAGTDYETVLFNFRIVGPDGTTLSPDMLRLQYEGSWHDLELTQDGDDLVGTFGPAGGFPMGAGYDATTDFRVKAQLDAPCGQYTATVTLSYLDPDPDWVLRQASQAFTVSGQATSMTSDVGTGWTMISVPVVGDDPVPETVFSDVIASGQPLVLYEWIPGASYHTPTQIDSGKSYWLYLFSPVTIAVTGDLPTGTYEVPLGSSGWYQISTPKWPVAWQDVEFTDGTDTKSFADAVTCGWIVPFVYLYNTADGLYYAADTASGVMQPWEGYWLFTSTDNLTMLIPMDQPYIPGGPTAQSLKPMSADAKLRPPAHPALPMDADALGVGFGNSPNPIRDVHTTTFYVKGAVAQIIDAIKVQIFDISGHLVFERVEQGATLDWHTDNYYGEYLANGVYLYKLYAQIDGQWVVSEVRKLAILR